MWEPFSALLLAAMLLGERPTLLQGAGAGGAIMLFGVWWINRRGPGGDRSGSPGDDGGLFLVGAGLKKSCPVSRIQAD